DIVSYLKHFGGRACSAHEGYSPAVARSQGPQRAVVVGGSSGIGAATARRLAKAGWTVTATGSRTVPEDLGAGTGYVQVDVRNKAAMQQFIDATIESDPLNLLVYSAGTNIPEREFDVLSDDDWATLLEVNVTGAFHCMSALLPHFRANGGG